MYPAAAAAAAAAASAATRSEQLVSQLCLGHRQLRTSSELGSLRKGIRARERVARGACRS
jgi:hypothetical protein